jgi:Flp pilus assembly protein TadG
MKSNSQSGQALVEFGISSAMLLTLLFGLIDFSRAIYTRQIMVNLSREAANLASRGTSLSNTFDAVRTSALPLEIDTKGFVILSVIYRNSNSVAVVTNQLTGGGLQTGSRVAAGGVGTAPVLPATNPALPIPKQMLYVAEIYYGFTPVTPVGRLLNLVLPSKLYDVAYF